MFHYPNLVNVTGWDDLMGHKDAFAKFHWPNMSGGTTCPSPAWDTEGDNLHDRIVQGNYHGYPDWEHAKGVEAPAPSDPEPEPVPEPEPPAPIEQPSVITDMTTRVDLGAENGGVMELRSVVEVIKNLKNERDEAITAINNFDEASKDAINKLNLATTTLFGKGWWFTKYWKLQEILKPTE